VAFGQQRFIMSQILLSFYQIRVMKKLYILSISLFFIQCAFAVLDTEELLIQIPSMNRKQAETIFTAMDHLNGVKAEGYCADDHVLMLMVDRALQPGNDSIFLQLKNNGFPEFDVKKAAAFEVVRARCPEYISAH
jgi:hypothetical protein